MNTEELLKECPCCGGKAKLTKGFTTGQVWPYGDFHRVFCGACQLRQLFYRTPAEAIAAWNRRPAAPAAESVPADPMDWPLPCDITVGAGTIKAGCKLRTLVARMHVMHNMIREGWSSAAPSPAHEGSDECLPATVKLPTCADEASAMAMVGTSFLQQFAPDRIRALQAQPSVQDAADDTCMLKRQIHNLKRHIEDYCQPAAEPCQTASHMGEFACANKHQCWEPCGELGHSAEHAKRAESERGSYEAWVSRGLRGEVADGLTLKNGDGSYQVSSIEREFQVWAAARADLQQQAGEALYAAIADGYEGGTMTTNPTGLGATISLHYIGPGHGEAAFNAISNAIDAIAAAPTLGGAKE